MIKVNGMSVFPMEIEAVLGQHPAVASVGVLARGEFDGIVLALAGLKRLGLTQGVSAAFEPVEMLPAIAAEGLARFCDAFVEDTAVPPQAAERVLRAAHVLGLEPKLHVDQLSDGGGAERAG